MRKIILIAFTIIIFLTGVNNLRAQTAEQPFGLKVFLGTHGYDGDLRNEISDFAFYDHLFGIGFAAYVHPYLDLSIDAQWMTLGVENGPNDAIFERRNSSFETDNLNLNLMARLKPWAGRARFDPYATAGMGLNFLHDDSGVRDDVSQWAFSIPFGIGVNYKIRENISLNVQAVYNRTFSNDIDNYPLAADEAAPTLSDEELDTRIDFDGKDHDDFLTTSIGLVFNFGGNEEEDLSDNKRFLRQPAENLEATEDASNETAETPGQAQQLNDKTLVALAKLRDAINQMPEESKNLKAEMVRIVNNIQFDNTKIIEPAYDELNSLTAIMQEYEGLSIDITARVDAGGTENYNDKRSMRRAQSVKDYLVNQGVDATRITKSALGEADPLMQERSQTAHAQNRSVQLTLSYNATM